MIIAIDGPAASGKSTAARALAAHLGCAFLDTGAMYRAVTREVLARGQDPQDAAAAALAAAYVKFRLVPRPGGESRAGAGLALEASGSPGDVAQLAAGQPEFRRVILPDVELRTAEVTQHVSAVSAHSAVRRVLVAHQQALGRGTQASERARGGLVAEGRDMTTVVFPDADFKFFLVASPAERARRRARELGDLARAEEIQRDIERRDQFDSRRADSPLVQAPDAIAVLTDGLDEREVLRVLLEVVAGTPRR